MTAAHSRSYAAHAPFDPDTITAQIAAMQARVGLTLTDQQHGEEGDADDWLDGWSSDRASEAAENASEKTGRWFER